MIVVKYFYLKKSKTQQPDNKATLSAHNFIFIVITLNSNMHLNSQCESIWKVGKDGVSRLNPIASISNELKPNSAPARRMSSLNLSLFSNFEPGNLAGFYTEIGIQTMLIQIIYYNVRNTKQRVVFILFLSLSCFIHYLITYLQEEKDAIRSLDLLYRRVEVLDGK